jgi:hypothetical protein
MLLWKRLLHTSVREEIRNMLLMYPTFAKFYIQNASEKKGKKVILDVCEIYLKMGDFKSLVAIYIEQQKWEAALKVIEAHPELAADVYLPYAHYLAINDRYE